MMAQDHGLSLKIDLDYVLRHNTTDPIQPKFWLQREHCSQEELIYYEAHQKYQQDLLRGFDLAMLRDSGCFGNIINGIDIAKASDLEVRTSLHPLFAEKNWPTSDLKEIKNGFPGTWNVYGNRQVRGAFMPCLYLASSMLHHAIHSLWQVESRGLALIQFKLTGYPRYDALLYGPRTHVEGQFDDGCDRYDDIYYHISSFRNRDDLAAVARARAARHHLSLLGGKFLFSIEPLASESSKGHLMGLTRYKPHVEYNGGDFDFTPGGRIIIAAETVLPLLIGALMPSEQLAHQFFLANVVRFTIIQ